MSRKYSNITEMDESIASLNESIGDVRRISDISDGTIVGVLESLKIANNGGKIISLDDYNKLEDKSGVYYVYDADTTDAAEFLHKIDQYIALMEDFSDKMGTTDISSIADGTVTGAIEKMKSNINIDDSTLVFRNITSGEPTDFTIVNNGGGGGGISQDDIDNIIGTTDISDIGDGTVTGAIDFISEEYVRAEDSITIVPAVDPTTGNYVYTSGPSIPTTGTIGGVDADTLGGELPSYYVNTNTLGNTDISAIGDGTLTGAIAALATSGGGSTNNPGSGNTTGGTTTIDPSIMGTTDISNIGDGTLTGAISELDTNKADKSTLIAMNQNMQAFLRGLNDVEDLIGSTNIAGLGDGTITGTLASMATSNSASVLSRINQLIGTTDISTISDGTITGAIADFDANKVAKTDFDKLMGNSDITTMEDGTITGIIACMHKSITQLFQSVSSGKQLVANAITDKGVATKDTDTFATMANNINSIVTGIKNVQPVNTIPFVSLHGHYPQYNSYLKISTDKCTVLKADKIDVALDPLMIIDLDKVKYGPGEIHMFGSTDENFQTSHFIYDGAIWKLSKDIPYPFCNGCSVTYKGELHVLGSSLKDSNGNSCGTKHYKWNGTKWIEVSTLPYEFHNGCAIVFDNELHILGGEDKSTHTNHYRFSNDYGWVKESVLPFNLYNGNAVILNNELHILGGNGDSTAHYSYNGEAWTQASILPYSCYKTFAVSYNNTIRMLGGEGDNSKKHYTFDGATWTAEAVELPYDFVNGVATIVDGVIHIMGGEDPNVYLKHYSYDGTNWITCADNPYTFNLGHVSGYNIPDISLAVLDIVEDGKNVRNYLLDITGVKNIGIYCRGDSDKSVVSITNLGWG